MSHVFLEEGKKKRKERKLVRQCYALIYINRSLFMHALLLDLGGGMEKIQGTKHQDDRKLQVECVMIETKMTINARVLRSIDISTGGPQLADTFSFFMPLLRLFLEFDSKSTHFFVLLVYGGGDR
jgi:hypothetical protein